MGWHKKHGNHCTINKVAVETIREEVDNRSSFDASEGHVGGIRNIFM